MDPLKAAQLLKDWLDIPNNHFHRMAGTTGGEYITLVFLGLAVYLESEGDGVLATINGTLPPSKDIRKIASEESLQAWANRLVHLGKIQTRNFIIAILQGGSRMQYQHVANLDNYLRSLWFYETSSWHPSQERYERGLLETKIQTLTKVHTAGYSISRYSYVFQGLKVKGVYTTADKILDIYLIQVDPYSGEEIGDIGSLGTLYSFPVKNGEKEARLVYRKKGLGLLFDFYWGEMLRNTQGDDP